MSWNSSAYTTLGSSMLTEALSGKRMTFTRAVGGAGTVQASELPNATESPTRSSHSSLPAAK